MLTINGVAIDAVLDTGGGRSMIDVDTAKAMGLPMDHMSEAEQNR